MVSIVSRLKGGIKQALDEQFGNSTKIMTPLDTYQSVYQHSINYPALKDYLWKIQLPALSTTSNKGMEFFNVDLGIGSNSLLGPIVNQGANYLLNSAANMSLNTLYGNLVSGSSNYPEGFVPRVITGSVPLPGFDTSTATYQGWKYTFPKSETVGPMSVDVWIDEQGFALAYYMLWHNKTKNRDGTVNYPAEYERDIPIALYKRDGTLSIKFTAYGCYPIGCTPINLSDGSGQGIIKSLRFNMVVHEIGLNQINGKSSATQTAADKTFNKVTEYL